MTSTDDVKASLNSEARDDSFKNAILRRLPYELRVRELEWLGYSIKLTPGYVLLTLRCFSGDSKVISFVGAATQRAVFIKAASLARQGKLSWSVDKYE